MQSLPPALAPLSAYRQFIAYRLEPKADGKMNKIPVSPVTGHDTNAHDPNAWTDFAGASQFAGAMGHPYGVGFVFTEADPLFFLDIDHAWDGQQWSPVAQELCNRLAGCAVEVSQSGTGLHIFGTYDPGLAHGCKNEPLGLELYTEKRFVALTGINATGNAAHYANGSLSAIAAQYFPVGSAESLEPGWWSDEPVAEWRGPTDDEALLARALRSTSGSAVFGGKASFADLWTADTAKLSPDESINDAALAQHLAFWTGNHAERIERLMRASGLVREKYDRPDYLPRTIRKACGMQKEWYAEKPSQMVIDQATHAPTEAVLVGQARAESAAAQWEMPTSTRVTGNCILGPDEQEQLFAGTVYLQRPHRALIPSGHLLDAGQFNAHFGGYSFVMDGANARISRKAWECLTESQLVRFSRAEDACFKPGLPTGALVTEGGMRRANIYVPITVPRHTGDPTPFLAHLAKMVPDEEDRKYLLGYMAACVQFQGTKFQWAPLIQGCEGNGKTLLALCVARSIGARYVHWPAARDLANTFNIWLTKNILYVVDEVFIQEHQNDSRDALWQMITGGEGIQLTSKGVDQGSGDFCGNFMLLSNHKNAARQKTDGRRVAPFITAQQSKADMLRDGMTEDYIRELIGWFRDANGYAIVTDFLHTHPIEQKYDPRYHVRAPRTSTTEQAVIASLGAVEQEILECVAQDMPGFAGGWVSSLSLTRMLRSMPTNRQLAQNKYRDVLRTLGYEYHPGLNDGRVNMLVAPDNGKPRLFVLKDGPLWGLIGPAEIARAYQTAQGA